MEGDPGRGFQLPKLDGISIHTLRMEGDDCKLSYRTEFPVFQSTPSAWRVTIGGQVIRYRVSISIHTLRMEGDIRNPFSLICALFQSTPSAWRVTVYLTFIVVKTRHFNPHPPHGG